MATRYRWASKAAMFCWSVLIAPTEERLAPVVPLVQQRLQGREQWTLKKQACGACHDVFGDDSIVG